MLGDSPPMYSMDDLLHLLHSDGADELRLHVGQPPILVLDGERISIEGPVITTQDVEELLRSVADSRQRRELRRRGEVEFIYEFRGRAKFVVRARVEHQQVAIDIH